MPKLCKRGITTAKKRFKVYPSAYANAHAVQVCKGDISDIQGRRFPDPAYMKRLSKESQKDSKGLTRWFKERWVNVCEIDSKGNYKPCGRNFAKLNPKTFPFCRPMVRVSKSTPKTVKEHTKAELKERCKIKRSKRQGIKGKPTFTRAPKRRMSQKRTQKGFPWISLKTANAFLKYAEARGVSKVARGKVKSKQTALGFMQAYNKANGNIRVMSNFSVKKKQPGNPGDDQTWKERRNAFCARHTAQQLKNNRPFVESEGKYKGLPTRQETGKIMWACSSLTESQLKKIIQKLKKEHSL